MRYKGLVLPIIYLHPPVALSSIVLSLTVNHTDYRLRYRRLVVPILYLHSPGALSPMVLFSTVNHTLLVDVLYVVIFSSCIPTSTAL